MTIIITVILSLSLSRGSREEATEPTKTQIRIQTSISKQS